MILRPFCEHETTALVQSSYFQGTVEEEGALKKKKKCYHPQLKTDKQKTQNLLGRKEEES